MLASTVSSKILQTIATKEGFQFEVQYIHEFYMTLYIYLKAYIILVLFSLNSLNIFE